MALPVQDSSADTARLDLRGDEPILEVDLDAPVAFSASFANEIRQLFAAKPVVAPVGQPFVVSVAPAQSTPGLSDPITLVIPASDHRPLPPPPSFDLGSGSSDPVTMPDGPLVRALESGELSSVLRANVNSAIHTWRITAPQLRWGVALAGLAILFLGAVIVYSGSSGLA